ncbi:MULTISPECIES: DUF1240 domain-containing protein [Enterobacterales]|uniref:DUF1240 domain-containing protein n=1 Tax=Enterobacterales TaxID=91347 RepID=UPI0021CF95A3|nr:MULTISPECIES: DUF1240 domain-containing protein [Enterobacterales]MCU6209746.1 DUF1240 domain-containing protein [Morganella morganii]
MPGWVKAIVSGLFFILFLALSVLMYDYMISLFNMENVIVFSAQIVIVTIATPLLLYVFLATTIEFSLGRNSIIFMLLMKYNKLIIRYLLYLGIAGLFISFPVSFSVNIYLLDKGYETCGKISWMSPTTYVKNLSLCDR